MDYDNFSSNRQKKLASDKRHKTKSTKAHKNCKQRNYEQKTNQINHSIMRHAHILERQEKINPQIEMRHYYCYQCDNTSNEPCKCTFFKWCGREGPFDKCQWRKISYDVLCPYHEKDYHQYLKT